jgi:hypothetical protein
LKAITFPGLSHLHVQSEILPTKLSDDRLMVNFDIQLLLKVIEHPHIMIAGEEIDGKTFVGEFSSCPNSSANPLG